MVKANFYRSLLNKVKDWSRNARPRLFKAVVLGLVIGLIGLLLSPFRFALNLEENTGLGLLFKLRGVEQPSDEVVVVSIEKESSDALELPNNPDKWPRSLHARLVENLVQEGAASITFDVHFIEPRNPEDDQLFAAALKKAGNVIIGEPLVTREIDANGSGGGQAQPGIHSIVKIVKPIELFAKAAVATAPFSLPRIPFKVNQYWGFQTGAGDSPTLPVVTYQLFTLPLYDEFLSLLRNVSPQKAAALPPDSAAALQAKGVKRLIRDIRNIFEGDPTLADNMLQALDASSSLADASPKKEMLRSLVKMYAAPNSRYINYYGPPRTITTIPFHQALDLHDGQVGGRQYDVKGKAVFVGLSEAVLADRKDSFYTVYSQADGIFIAGVEIAATALSNIIEDTPVKPVGLAVHTLILFLWGILAGIACRLFSLKIGALNIAGLSILYLGVAVLFFKTNGIWYPIVIPLFFQVPMAFAGAVGIEYSRLFKEFLVKLRMEDDLTSAHDLQMSMLPANCPEVEGYQIAASSTMAMEVGGDFFDFFMIGEGKVGLIIGDVTGKSVSGALIMAASRSVFRMLAEEELSVGETMIRANRRIKQDIKSGMFVALLYAVLDTKDGSVGLCSAGQTQPILLSAKTAEATLVETVGDTFPLGILDDVNYEETPLQMEPGDKVVYYTDGIVEAMNKQEEMYGFERLHEIVNASHAETAEALMNDIINDVSDFTGAVPQHDDLTIIVVSADP
ncbi:MAG: SpoIIE family protein phosphatase [Desulfobacteraceae bacterium]|nr:SpoIIE family protein phosphatase [Desulfobacteraceae bacterium]MBC2750553.1 SpoIIE family protein phosphatase [Desulfobacteraceae bacterium]